MNRKNKSGKYFKFLIYLIIIVLVNIAGTTLFFRLDMTKNKIYSLSPASKKAVSNLSEPLTIKVFFTKNLPAPHNNTERYLHDLLEEYAAFSGKYFNFQFYDVSAEQGDFGKQTQKNQELANDYGIRPIQIQLIEKDEVKFQRAYMGLVLIHGDIIERIPTISTTDGLEYRLTTKILKMNHKISALLSLSNDIDIDLWFSSSLKSVAPLMGLGDLSQFPEIIRRAIDRLNQKNYNRLKFRHLDPSLNASLQSESDKYSVLDLRWPDIPQKNIKSGSGLIGLVLRYQDRNVTLPLINVLKLPLIGTQYQLVKTEDLEESVNKNVETLIQINEDLGYLSSHDTKALYPGRPNPTGGQKPFLRNLNALMSQQYSMKLVDLTSGPIPDNLNCLVIAGPEGTFSDYDLFLIDQFLMKGKNLAVFLDAFKIQLPPNQMSQFRPRQGPMYVPLHTGLEKLLNHYGAQIKASYIMDEECYKQTNPTRMGGGEQPIYFAPIIKNEYINKEMPFLKNIKGLVALQISPIIVDGERISKNNLTSHQLLATSSRSWEMSGQINLNPMVIRPPVSDDHFQSYPFAVMLEGEFPSYFAGKSIPEKPVDEPVKEDDKEEGKVEEAKKEASELTKIQREGDVITQGRPGKVFIISSSEMLTDAILDEQGRSPNSMFIMNLIDSLNNRDDIAQLRSKEQRFNPLMDTDSGSRTVIKSFNIVGLPILVSLFGIGVWFRRHSRKKNIAMMFQK